MARKYRRRRADTPRSLAGLIMAMLFDVRPVLFAMALAALFLREVFLTHRVLTIMGMAGFILIFVGMGISIFFGRSKVALILLLLGLSQAAFSLPGPDGLDSALYYGIVYFFSAYLLPMNIVVFSLLKDRSLFTRKGQKRILFVLVQIMAVSVVVVSQDREILGYIQRDLAFSPDSFGTPIPPKALALMLAGMLLMVLRWRAKAPVDKALLFCLPLLLLAFHYKEPVLTPFYTAAILLLTIAAVQDSYAIAYLDELTGIPSRRLMNEELVRLDGRYTVAMVDIDFFKKINDRHGHYVGDDVLRLIGAVLISEMTGVGKFFRYGGEEFIILFPNKAVAEAAPLLENLRVAIARRKFILRGKTDDRQKLTVTVSIGVAERIGHSRPEDVIKYADEALYQAKQNGRNCVVCADPAPAN